MIKKGLNNKNKREYHACLCLPISIAIPSPILAGLCTT
jgi:hypothetical protein